MLQYMFEANADRRVLDCNRSVYNRAELHPRRNMKEHDLIYMIEGEWEIWQEQTAFMLSAGDMLLLFAGRNHFSVKPCTPGTKAFYAHFNALRTDVCAEKTAALKDYFLFPAQFAVPARSQIPIFFEKLIGCYWNRSFYAERQAADYLSLILCEMSLLAANEPMEGFRTEIMNRLLRTLAASPERFYAMDEMCALINVSRKTLYNYFKIETGLAPHAYQLKSKLDSARQLMREEPAMSLREVAYRHGFCDEYHFSRMFKREYGHSPKRR